MPQSSAIKLSICIATLNRADYIGETLDSILRQVTTACEVVVLDCASTDGTEQIVSPYTLRFPQLRYIKQANNNGIDRDYDRVVELSTGEYCWLMTDDDLLKNGAVAAALNALHNEVSVAIVNAEMRCLDMSRIVQARCLSFTSDQMYGPSETDRLFRDVNSLLKYIGAVIIKRSIWLTRSRAPYFGSMFIHLGVIFQQPLPGNALLIAEPFIIYRLGNSKTFSSNMFEIIFIRWPAIVRTLAISEATKLECGAIDVWRDPQELLRRRALDQYSLREYRKLIRPQLQSRWDSITPIVVALVPGSLANALFLAYYSAIRKSYRGILGPQAIVQGMRDSRFYFRNWRIFKMNS